MTGKIKLVHSGGNSVSLAVPTSNPSASEVEFKLPQADGSSGQALVTDSSGNLSFAGTGKILQHKIISKTTKSSTSSTTPGIIPDFSIAITPTASDSIMVIEASMYFSITQHAISTRIYKDSDIVIQPATYDSNDDGTSSHYIGSNTARMMHQTISSFETAGNTNARTYSVYWRVSSGTAYMNRYSGSDSYNGVSILRVTEVAA